MDDTQLNELITNRHPSTQQVAQWFQFEHLSGKPRMISGAFQALAVHLIEVLTDGPELTVALRKLLESKDAAVRHALLEA